MPPRNPSGTYKLGSLLTLFYHYKINSSSSSLLGHNHGLWISTRPLGYNYGSSMHGGHRLFSSTSMAYRKYKRLNETNDKIQVQAPIPDTPKPNFSFSTWAKGFVGSILSLMLAYLKQKWDNLQKLEGKLEKTAEEVEYVTEVVEKVATTTEKVSAELADKLPGNGKLKQTALMVEHLSTIAASDAQLTENFIDKIDHLKQDFENLEKLVEPVVYRNKEVKQG